MIFEGVTFYLVLMFGLHGFGWEKHHGFEEACEAQNIVKAETIKTAVLRFNVSQGITSTNAIVCYPDTCPPPSPSISIEKVKCKRGKVSYKDEIWKERDGWVEK